MAARYECEHGCASIQAEGLDGLVTDLVVRYLAADPELRPLGDDSIVLAARAEAEGLAARLESFRDSAARGETSPASLARIEATLTGQIADAYKRAEQATVPAVLRDILHGAPRLAAVRRRFKALPVTGKREIIATLLDVAISRVNGQVRSADPIDTDRVTITWRTP